MRRLGAALVLAGGLALGACEDVVDPDGVRGTYELIEVEGQPLPAVMFDGQTEFGHVLATALSGSLTLREVTYTERVLVDIVLDGTPISEDVIVVEGQYSIDGQLLTFEPDNASPVFTGTLQGGVLTTFEVDPEFGELMMTWQR